MRYRLSLSRICRTVAGRILAAEFARVSEVCPAKRVVANNALLHAPAATTKSVCTEPALTGVTMASTRSPAISNFNTSLLFEVSPRPAFRHGGAMHATDVDCALVATCGSSAPRSAAPTDPCLAHHCAACSLLISERCCCRKSHKCAIPRLLHALRRRVEMLGGVILEQHEVLKFEIAGDRVLALHTRQGRFGADAFCCRGGRMEQSVVGRPRA